jgi:hypothetical protein
MATTINLSYWDCVLFVSIVICTMAYYNIMGEVSKTFDKASSPYYFRILISFTMHFAMAGVYYLLFKLNGYA